MDDGQSDLLSQQHDKGKRRPMTVWDGFIYNVLAMGAIFPWVYVWGPASFPNANLFLALILAFLAQIPISLSYSFLAAALPVDAGDYMYQKLAFGKLGSVVVLGGFVICILEWLPISGWLFATLGVAPLLLSAGVAFHARLLTEAGVAVESPGGTMIVSLVVNLLAVLLLRRGLRIFARLQRVLFGLTLIAIAVMTIVFLRPDALNHLNEFAKVIALHLNFYLPISQDHPFTEVVMADAANHGYSLLPSGGFFSTLASTLGLVPIAWTSLQWATYSVEQNDEIEGAKSFKNQLIMLLLSAGVVTVLLLVVAASLQHGLRIDGRDLPPLAFWRSFDTISWASTGSTGIVLFSQQVLQPYPNVLAMACSGSLFLSSLIALGFLANAFQISCNCFIGIGKIISAMSRDGILPRWFGPEGINSVTHAPVRAYWTYLFLGIPVICLYAIIPPWNDYALSVVTVACGSVFFLTTFAATRLPTERFRKALAESDIGHVKPWVFQATGYIGALIAILMIGSYVVVPKLGLQGKTQVGSLVLGVIVVTSIVVVSRGSRGSDSKADEVSVSIQTD